MPLADLPFLQYVDERDIDFILLEEFHSEPRFVSWFVRQFVQGKGPFAFIGAWHSVSDPTLGESDLTVVADVNGERVGILIENKIDAPAQPDQARRYISRGLVGSLAGEWIRYISCIVAPNKYLQGDPEAEHYHHRVSYEEIRDWLRDNTPDTSRRAFRLDVLNTAINQNRRGRIKHRDERVSQFFRDYYDFAGKHFPNTRMREYQDVGANNTWPEFRPDGLRDNYARAFILHKTDLECVDLQLEGLGSEVARLRELNQSLLDSEVRLVAKGKSAVFSIRVPRMDTKMSLAGQEPQAQTALRAVERLTLIARSLKLSV